MNAVLPERSDGTTSNWRTGMTCSLPRSGSLGLGLLRVGLGGDSSALVQMWLLLFGGKEASLSWILTRYITCHMHSLETSSAHVTKPSTARRSRPILVCVLNVLERIIDCFIIDYVAHDVYEAVSFLLGVDELCVRTCDFAVWWKWM